MGLIPQSIYDTYNLFVDDMINSAFGLNCTLIYPAIRSSCANCIYDTMNNKSSNQYNGTGPQPFTFGVCPWCGGLGYTETPKTEVIKLRIYFSRKHWIKIDPMINIPDGSVQCIGFITDLPKIMQSEKMLLNSDIAGYGNTIYKLHGEPITSGFGNNRYIVSMWNRSS